MESNTPPPADGSLSEGSRSLEEERRADRRGKRPGPEAKAVREADAEALAAAREQQLLKAHERKSRTKRLIERGGVDAKYGSPGATVQENLYERLLSTEKGRELLRSVGFEETEAWPARADDEWLI